MKKRKRAQAEPRRDQSSPDAASPPEPETQGAESAASEDAAPEHEPVPGDEGAPAEVTASEHHVTPAAVEAAAVAEAGDAPAQSVEADSDGEPASAEDASALDGAAPPAPDSSASGARADEDSSWEDAPTRELDIGNMEFAATWTEANDTLPNVEGDQEGAEATAEGETTPDGEGAQDGEALPSDTWRVESILESLLFATDRPLGVSDLKRLLAVKDSKVVTDALGALRDRRADSGIQLISVAGGWQLRTHPANGAWVAKLVAGRPQRLSRAMMETLAIVAYRQPITRPEIDEIRGVDCGPVLRTLLDRNLIRVIGKKEEVGRPMLYGTTPEFLKTFSLRDLTELPTLREFHELGADERAQVEAKLPRPEGAVADIGADGAPIRPSTLELPQADPVEDDALFDELDRASEAAARATAAAEPEPLPAEGEPTTGAAGMSES